MPELRGIGRGKRGQSHAVRAVAAEQWGVVSRAQLGACGVSRWAIDRAVGSGGLHRLLPGVYSVVLPELLSDDGRLIAASMAAGRGALLAHGTAAWRWQIIPAPPQLIELAVTQPRRAPNGVALFRYGKLLPAT